MRSMLGAKAAKRKTTAGHPRPDRRPPTLREVYRRLYAANGKQHWWPGDTRFEIMVGAVLTQNTAWINVERAITNLRRARALTPVAIVQAKPKKLAEWLRPSGYFNVKTKRLKVFCKWLIAAGGAGRLAKMPTSELRHALLVVHGVGPETADDILLYAFHRPVFVVDAYTRRIFTRLGVLGGNESYEAIRDLFERSLGPDVPLFNEYHALIVAHGKNICRPKPKCDACCLWSACLSRDP